MNKKAILLTTLILFVIAPCSLFAKAKTQKNDSTFKKYESYQKTVQLPIVNFEKPYSVDLIVNIPKNFKCLQEDAVTSTMLEFIPKNEQADNWSEIVTTMFFPGKKINARQLVYNIKEEMLYKFHKPKVLHNVEDLIGGIFPYAVLIMTYQNEENSFNGEYELLALEYVSGPLDCSGWQYTIKLDKDSILNDELEKLYKFRKESVTITDAPMKERFQ